MIRVFFLGMIGLVALVLIARQFPAAPRPDAAREEALERAAGPFARMDGVWEGAIVTYAADGTRLSSDTARRQHDSLSPGHQEIVLTLHHADGRTDTLRGRSTEQQGSLRRELRDAAGGVAVYTGRQAGLAVIWHRSDPAAGIEETLREEVIRTVQGDLYTLDGAGSYENGRQRVLVEGRFRRPDTETDLARWDRPLRLDGQRP